MPSDFDHQRRTHHRLLPEACPESTGKDDDRHVYGGLRSDVAHVADFTLETADRTAPRTSSNARRNPPGAS